MTIISEPVNVRTPIAAAATELDALRALGVLLDDDAAEALLLTKGGEREATIPPTALLLLRRVVDHLVRERAVRIETFGREVPTWEAADILGEPIERVRQLVAEGVLPARDTDQADVVKLQLIKLTDLRAYQTRHAARQTEAINELLRLSEELGLYDRDIRVEGDIEGEAQ